MIKNKEELEKEIERLNLRYSIRKQKLEIFAYGDEDNAVEMELKNTIEGVRNDDSDVNGIEYIKHVFSKYNLNVYLRLNKKNEENRWISFFLRLDLEKEKPFYKEDYDTNDHYRHFKCINKNYSYPDDWNENEDKDIVVITRVSSEMKILKSYDGSNKFIDLEEYKNRMKSSKL